MPPGLRVVATRRGGGRELDCPEMNALSSRAREAAADCLLLSEEVKEGGKRGGRRRRGGEGLKRGTGVGGGL